MVRQAQSISPKPLAERLNFYRAVILHCDLDTSRALLFVETVGDDPAALGENLRELRASSEFGKLSQVAQRNVEKWITQMELNGRQNRHALQISPGPSTPS